ncbi:MAG: YlbF family regulator [Bacillota bacterium]|nr:YlbF family regulator [Bacillota bacterium]
MNPHDAAHALARALRESEEFKTLKELQDKLKGEETARNMLLDFRRQQFELQKQKLSGVEVSSEQEEKLEKLFEVINMNTTVKNFLEAEYRAAILLQDVQKIIGEATESIIDTELTPLGEELEEEKE